MKKVLKITGIILGVLIAIPLVFLGGAYLNAWLILGGVEGGQRERVAALESEIATLPGGVHSTWRDGAGTGLSDELRLNEIQFIGTHNSYAKRPNWLQEFAISLVEPDTVPTLRYDHADFTTQLTEGVRSFEIDLRYHGEGKFSVSHVPVVGNDGTVANLELGLKEIALWSQSHPDHLPISIMLEFKEDWMFLDPSLKRFNHDGEAMTTLNQLLTDTFGESLLTPDQVRGSESSVQAAALGEQGWPTLGKSRGKVMLFMWAGEALREQYLGAFPDLRGAALFTAARDNAGSDIAVIIHDAPDATAIGAYVEQGFFVRTRADADLKLDEADPRGAFDSGAQVISTDYPWYAPHESGYQVSFDGGSSVRENPVTPQRQ